MNMLTRSSDWILNWMRYTGYMSYEDYRRRVKDASDHLN